LENEFDAVVLCAGAAKPRDLAIPAGDPGIEFAADYLARTTRTLLDEGPARWSARFAAGG
jgi:glutamate synthase (NADPH/NADH) small chain